MRPWILVLAGSILLGAALGAAAPASWTFGWSDGPLLGSALYVAGLRRYVIRREADGPAGAGSSLASMLPGLLLRTALFAAILSLQSFLCFDAVPEADVRRGYVVLSAWVVMQALIDTGTARGGPGSAAASTSASRPLAR